MNNFKKLDSFKNALQSYINELNKYEGPINPVKVTTRLNRILKEAA